MPLYTWDHTPIPGPALGRGGRWEGAGLPAVSAQCSARPPALKDLTGATTRGSAIPPACRVRSSLSVVPSHPRALIPRPGPHVGGRAQARSRGRRARSRRGRPSTCWGRVGPGPDSCRVPSAVSSNLEAELRRPRGGRGGASRWSRFPGNFCGRRSCRSAPCSVAPGAGSWHTPTGSSFPTSPRRAQFGQPWRRPDSQDPHLAQGKQAHSLEGMSKVTLRQRWARTGGRAGAGENRVPGRRVSSPARRRNG